MTKPVEVMIVETAVTMLAESGGNPAYNSAIVDMTCALLGLDPDQHYGVKTVLNTLTVATPGQLN